MLGDARLFGIAAAGATGLVAVALGQPNPGGGFDCVVQPNTNVCYACSGCRINSDGEVVCGNIQNTASCGMGVHAHCDVIVRPGEPTEYIAECLPDA